MIKVDTIGDRIKFVRLKRCLTRKQLGAIMNLNYDEIRISAYENNKVTPRANMLLQFAIALNVSQEWLMSGNLDYRTYETLEGVCNDEELFHLCISNTINYGDLMLKYFCFVSLSKLKDAEINELIICIQDYLKMKGVNL